MATEEETAAAIEAVKLFVICGAAYNGFARPARAAWGHRGWTCTRCISLIRSAMTARL